MTSHFSLTHNRTNNKNQYYAGKSLPFRNRTNEPPTPLAKRRDTGRNNGFFNDIFNAIDGYAALLVASLVRGLTTSEAISLRKLTDGPPSNTNDGVVELLKSGTV